MSDNTERWITIPNWFGELDGEGLQHYRDRDPKWIKTYRRLLSRDEYRDLTGHRRAILHGLWLEYASTDGRLRHDTRSISYRLALKVTTSDLKALSDAGFILLIASKPLALSEQRASPEKKREENRFKKGPETRAHEAPRPQPQTRPQPGRTNLPQRITADVLERWIRAGAIPDLAVLEHELKSAKVSDSDAKRLRALLPQSGTFDGAPTLGDDLYANH